MLKCPNCRCEIDARVSVCPYCGVQLRRKRSTSGGGYERSQTQRASTYHASTHTTRATGTRQRADHHTTETRLERRRRENYNVYLEIIILLLVLLIVLNLLELFAVIMT